MTKQKPTREYEGNAILIGCPGGGKTRTVAAKMEYLFEPKQLPLDDAKMLTFSRSAANELLNRLSCLTYGKQVSTIHKFGLDLLRQNGFNGKVFGSKEPDAPDADRIKLIYEFLLTDTPLFRIGGAHKELSYMVNDCLGAIDRYKSGKDEKLPEAYRPAYEYYQDYLRKTNQIDFNDMLTLSINEIEKHPVHLRWLFLDEGHDTSMLQYELFRRIDADFVWAIFDPHQMIYRWNGADERNYTRFREDYSPKEFQLLNDWRSTPEIVSVLEKIYPRGLVPKGEGESKIEFIEVEEESQYSYALQLATEYPDHEILARTNYQLPTAMMKKALKKQGFSKSEIEKDIFIPKVNEGTIHWSKGTQAHTVILVGGGDRYIPFYRSRDYVEEKNLLYVACSRAKNNLFVLYEERLSEFFGQVEEVIHV